MEAIVAVVVGVLFGTGIYMLMRRSLVKLVLGLALIGHAANLLIFSSGGLRAGRPPLIAEDDTVLRAPFADPVPQALILTAIVIGFGVQSFAMVLLKRAYRKTKTDDMDLMNTTDT